MSSTLQSIWEWGKMSKELGLHYTYYVSNKHTFPDCALAPRRVIFADQFPSEPFVSDLVENFDEASKDEAN